ncbi:MAG: NifB/NifX family molybdenum-iron cluster-binding protein [Promethearchaeota archaeon]
MKIAISSDSGNVSAHFGRAPTYTFLTIENNKLIEKKELQNPGHTIGSIPKFISEQGAKCMIAGGMGRRAQDFFNQLGIEVIMGVTGKIEDVITKILNGTLEGGESICSPGGGRGYGVEKIHTEEDNDHEHHHTHD